VQVAGPGVGSVSSSLEQVSPPPRIYVCRQRAPPGILRSQVCRVCAGPRSQQCPEVVESLSSRTLQQQVAVAGRS